MARIIEAFAQFLDDAGNPLVDGWLQFLESGTNNTDKDTFKNVKETILNTNPVQLDGAGRCPNVFGSGSYRAVSFTNNVLTNMPAQQIQVFDPIDATQTPSDFTSWDPISTYSQTDIVKGSDNLYYQSLTSGNQGNDPVTDAVNWEQIDFVRIWNTNKTYGLNDNVLASDGRTYISLVVSNLGNDPVSNSSEWETDRLRTVSDMLGLINIATPTDGDTAQMSGFFVLFPQSTFLGGGTFVWQSGLNKNLADGGTIVDPDNTGGFDGTISTLDAFLAAQGGGAGTGCWVRTEYSTVSPEWFGGSLEAAVGTGNNVILTSGTLYEPKITLTLAIGQSIKGEANSQFSATIRPTAAVGVTIATASRAGLEYFTIDGVNTSAATGIFINGDSGIGTNITIVKEVLVENFTGLNARGIFIRETVGVDFYNVRTLANFIGVDILGVTGSFPTVIAFYNCAFRTAITKGFRIQRAYHVKFYNCLFEENAEEGLRIEGPGPVERVHIIDGFFENNFDSSATDYQLVIEGAGIDIDDVTVHDTFFHNGPAKAARFSGVINLSLSTNDIPDEAATILIDTNTTGWIVQQDRGITTGQIVDATGRMFDRDQDVLAWTDQPYNAGDFTTEVGTWTVEPGDVLNYSYKIIGKIMHLNVVIATSSVSAGTQFFGILIPNGKTVKDAISFPCLMAPAGIKQLGTAFVDAGDTIIICRRAPQADMPVGTNTEGMSFMATFEIN